MDFRNLIIVINDILVFIGFTVTYAYINQSSNKLKVKVKKLHPQAKIPTYAKDGDGAMDLTAISKVFDMEKGKVVFDTGLAFEIPYGFVGLVFPRSSICKTNLMLSNSVGIIDAGYRGSIKFFFDPGSRPKKNYEVGDRIGQIMIIPHPNITLIESDDLSDSERGDGGIGSTGK
jgi:dUTP pyrophosphatase